MKTNRFIAIAVASSFLLGAPVTTSSLAAEGMSKADTVRATFLDYAKCTIENRGEDARAAVALFPDSREEMAALQGLPDSACVKYASSTFSTRLFRGALYTVMYQDRFANGAPAALAPKPDFAAGTKAALTPEQQAMVQLRDFADCVVRRDSVNAHAAVIGPVGSDAEKTAFTNLAPSFDACMVQGHKISFSKPVVVGLLAEVLYREAQG